MNLSRRARLALQVAMALGLAVIYVPLLVVVLNSFNTSRTFGFPPAGNQTYLFPAGTPVQDFEHDLPLLAKGVRP